MANLADHSKDWMELAQSAMLAAESVCSAHPRSSASRAYYAAFSASHAILSHLRPTVNWPGRGNFKHGQIPGELRWTLTNYLNLSPYQADVYRERLEDAYNLRRLADYRPRQHFEWGSSTDAMESAQTLVRLAERVLR